MNTLRPFELKAQQDGYRMFGWTVLQNQVKRVYRTLTKKIAATFFISQKCLKNKTLP